MASGTYPNSEIPTRVPLAVVPGNRDNTTARDAKVINGYMEKTDDGYQAYKRMGITNPGIMRTIPTGFGQGAYVDSTGSFWLVVAGVLYNLTATSNFTCGSVDVTTVASFNEIPGNPYPSPLMVSDTKIFYSLHSLLSTTLPGGAVPVPGTAYLDGTLYIMDYFCNIWGSNFNDASTWSSSNVIKAQINPGNGVALAKHLVYVVALKDTYTEIFYDAANASGSPLSPVQGAKINWGCANAHSIQDIDGDLLWLSNTHAGSYEVIHMSNLKAKVVSTKPIERLLAKFDVSVNNNIRSWTHKSDGHSFYCLTSVPSNITLVYDIKEGLWAQWTDTSGNALPFTCSANAYLQSATDGILYTMAQSQTDDNGSVITFDLITPNFDAGIDRRKIVKLLRLLADKTPGSVLQIRHNDQDYDPEKWSAWRNINLNQERPFLSDDGTFVRRSYQIRHQCNTQLRLNALDLQMDLGSL